MKLQLINKKTFLSNLLKLNQQILAFDTSKTSPKDSIPPKTIKDNCDIFSKKII